MAAEVKTYTVRIETDSPDDLDVTVREAVAALTTAVPWDGRYTITIKVLDSDGVHVTGHSYGPGFDMNWIPDDRT